MELLPKWLKPARASSAVGIYLTPTSLLAIAERDPSVVVERSIGQGETVSAALRSLIEEQSWQGHLLSLVLNRHWYKQQQMEKPPIPDEELGQALPWTMRELVNEPIESLLFDYINLPAGPAGQQRIAVYSTGREALAQIVQAVTPLCDIATIGVDELALANLLAPEERGLLLHKVPGQELTLTFIHQRQWHFSRTIRGFQALDDEQMSGDQFVFDNLL